MNKKCKYTSIEFYFSKNANFRIEHLEVIRNCVNITLRFSKTGLEELKKALKIDKAEIEYTQLFFKQGKYYELSISFSANNHILFFDYEWDKKGAMLILSQNLAKSLKKALNL